MKRDVTIKRSKLGLFSIQSIALAFTACAGMALAQDATEDQAAQLEVKTEGELGVDTQVEEATRIRGRGARLSQRVGGMLDEARREKDIIRITCLNDKLTQVNANLRTVEQRVEALEQAVQTSNEGRRNHEFTVLTVLARKFDVLEQEANQCIGQDLFETGETKVTSTIDPFVPIEFAEAPPQPTSPSLPVVPPPSSPTM